MSVRVLLVTKCWPSSNGISREIEKRYIYISSIIHVSIPSRCPHFRDLNSRGGLRVGPPMRRDHSRESDSVPEVRSVDADIFPIIPEAFV